MEPPSIDLPEIMEPIPENVSRKLSLNTVPTALLHTMSVTLNSVIDIVCTKAVPLPQWGL